MKVILMRGETYLHRREIRSLGGKWSYEKEGWLLPNDKIKEISDLAYNKGFYIEEIEVDNDPFNQTIDEIRASRQERADRKAEILVRRAESRERKASALDKQVSPYMNDWAFVTQPILVGHHSEKSFRNLKDRISRKVDKKFELSNEAGELRSRAEALSRPVAVKGDAERRRELRRQANDEVIKVGSKIFDFAFGNGEVMKINKLTYTIKWERSGHSFTRDKSFVRLRDVIDKL
jgi:hypothetical protein